MELDVEVVVARISTRKPTTICTEYIDAAIRNPTGTTEKGEKSSAHPGVDFCHQRRREATSPWEMAWVLMISLMLLLSSSAVDGRALRSDAKPHKNVLFLVIDDFRMQVRLVDF